VPWNREEAMREHSLIFQPESVRGMLSDPPIKWQSRRIVSPQNSLINGSGKGIRKCWPQMKLDSGIPYAGGWEVACGRCGTFHSVTPRIRLWDLVRVKETWAPEYRGWPICHKADCSVDGVPCEPKHVPHRPDSERWRSPLYMTRDVSRAWLLISEMRGQRVQGISEEDAMAEGLMHDPCGWFVPGNASTGARTARDAYRQLWDSIQAKRPQRVQNTPVLDNKGRRRLGGKLVRGYDWSSNPLVWAFTWNRVLTRAEADEYLRKAL
jgi:hypothetical protein